MYLEACLQQRWHFSPFVALVDELMGLEAMATLKRIASRLATKWKQSYSKTCGYVKSRIVITLVRATHRCIRGSQVPAHRISVQRPIAPGGVPPATSALLPLCRLCGQAAGGGGDGYPEKDSQSPGHQVEAAILKDMQSSAIGHGT